jgi:hypothetical protein
MNYFEHMTKEQQTLTLDFQDSIIKEIKEIVTNLQKIDEVGIKGHIPLPATAASGKPVLHGANVTIYKIRQYYRDKLVAIRPMIDREVFENLVPREYL